jgi:uncharacterized membrane protein
VKSARNVSIDFLRGVVMILMALDHAREFFGNTPFDPLDPDKTTLPLYVTRWVTHFCAPSFVFLAGTAVYLSGARGAREGGKSPAELTRFLVTRGLWLALLEVTVVRFCWLFDLDYGVTWLQVIWAIGCSMVVLGLLVRLPMAAIVAIGGALVLGHNLLDGVHAAKGTASEAVWSVLHEPAFPREAWGGARIGVLYPLIPWIGVMALGYAAGAWVVRPAEERQRRFLRAGLLAIGAFVLLRASNVYGDPAPWSHPAQAGGVLKSVLSFFNCQKYPPSLCFLLMTLGPAACALALFDRASLGQEGTWLRPVVIFGRVPLFYYVLHLALLHTAAIIALSARSGHFVRRWNPFDEPVTFGLASVYVAWVAVLALLYVPCRWFAGVKARRRDAWLSYL